MKFVSPYTLPGISTPTSTLLERKDLQMARKRLIAEIDLSDTQTVSINGQDYTKDDILKLFDEYDQEDVLLMHQMIARDPAFLNFLERGEIPVKQNIQVLSVFEVSRFQEFVSPYFREQFEPLLRDYYKRRDYMNLIKLLKLNRFMTMQDEEACFRKCYEDINGLIDKIDETNRSIKASRSFGVPADVAEAYSKNFISSISLFPDFFMELRGKLARYLIILYVECYNVLKRPDISGEIIRNLAYLKVDEEVRTELKRREEEYRNATASAAKAYSGGNSSSSGGSKAAVYGVFFVIAILVKVLLLGRSCGRERHDYSYLNNNIFNNSFNQPRQDENDFYESQETKKFISFLDSVYEAQPKTAKKAVPGKSKFSQPARIYEEVLKHDGFFTGGLKDTVQLVLMNTSAYELCVVLTAKSGAAAWYIPPGDSMVVYSNESLYKVYFAEGRNFTVKKKYKVYEYDNNLGHYNNKSVPVKVFKSYAQDNRRSLLNPQLVDQRLVSQNSGDEQTDRIMQQLSRLSRSGTVSGIYNRRMILFFESDEYGGISVSLKNETRLKNNLRNRLRQR